MKVFRFMCKKEFENYRNGINLINAKEHEGKTNSVGFCFLDYEEYTPERAMHFLTGIVDLDVCAVFETDVELDKTWGIYAKPLEECVKPESSLFEILMEALAGANEKMEINEFCTKNYNNNSFKLIKYTENLAEAWNPLEEQKKFDWRYADDNK